jgi:hypothetical protein
MSDEKQEVTAAELGLDQLCYEFNKASHVIAAAFKPLLELVAAEANSTQLTESQQSLQEISKKQRRSKW